MRYRQTIDHARKVGNAASRMTRGGKDGFKLLIFFVFLNQKPRKVEFFWFYGFLDIIFFV